MRTRTKRLLTTVKMAAMLTTTPLCFYLPITTRVPPFHVLLLFYNCDDS